MTTLTLAERRSRWDQRFTPYGFVAPFFIVVFAQLFNRDVGVVNYVLHTVFRMDNVDFTNSKWPAQLAISTIVIWRWTGYNALIYLAAMQAIPTDLYEAATIDGASRFKQFV